MFLASACADIRYPVSVAAMTVQGIQTLVAQRSSPGDPLVVTVGSLVAGSAPNVIPDEAVLLISLRATTMARARDAHELIVGISRGMAKAYGLSVEAALIAELPPTVSDAPSVELAQAVVTDLFGPDAYRPMTLPEMISEDFSLFLSEPKMRQLLASAAVAHLRAVDVVIDPVNPRNVYASAVGKVSIDCE